MGRLYRRLHDHSDQVAKLHTNRIYNQKISKSQDETILPLFTLCNNMQLYVHVSACTNVYLSLEIKLLTLT